MANYREDILDIELENGSLHRSFLRHTIGSGDALGNRFGVRVFRNGEPVELTGTCAGYFIRSDGATVPITNGVIDGNVAYVTLTETCYALEGVFSLAIKITDGGETVTMRIVDGMVSRTSTDEAVDPGEVIQNIEDLIEAIEAAVASIPPEYDTLVEAVGEDVFGIRNLLKAEDILDTAGKFIGAYGVIGNSANHIISGYVRLLKGDRVEYDLAGSDGSVVLVCEYNIDKEYRNTIAVGAGSSTAVTGTYTAPTEVFLRFCCRRDYAGKITINNGATFTTDAGKSLAENMGFAKGILNISDLLPLEGYCIHATDGELVQSANYYYSDYIRFEQGDVVEYSLRGSDNSISLFALYNKDKNWLKNVAVGVQYQTDVTGTFTVPAGCYARFCNRKDNPAGYIRINGGLSNGIKEYMRDFEDIPEYWRQEIEEKISEYNDKNAIVGDHGVSFAFVSDTHWSTNAQNSPKLINYICNHTNLDRVIHGGDYTVNALDDIRGFVNAIEKPLDFLPCIGNHEYDNSLQYTKDELWSCGFKRSEKLYKYVDGFNYCHDDEFQKVRFIVLDYRDADAADYLTEHAAELAEGWTVVVICHEYWGDRESASDPVTPNANGAAIAAAIDSGHGVWDAEVAMYLVGHIHFDKSTTTATGVPIVSINCDAYTDGQSYNWGGYKMEKGTTTEQCIDLVNIDTKNRNIYMTRVGAGSDRSFSY